MKGSFFKGKAINFKQLIGIILMILGVGLLVFAGYQKNRVSSARNDVDSFSKFFSKNPISEWGEKSIHAKLDSYDTQIMWCFIASGALIVIGGFITYRYRKKSR